MLLECRLIEIGRLHSLPARSWRTRIDLSVPLDISPFQRR